MPVSIEDPEGMWVPRDPACSGRETDGFFLSHRPREDSESVEVYVREELTGIRDTDAIRSAWYPEAESDDVVI
jgi:hypothetical protein